MRNFFIKLVLLIGIFAFAMLMLDSGTLNHLLHLPGAVQPVQQSSLQSPQPDIEVQESTPGIVRWITQTTQPVADELRVSLSQWWETQKTQLANSLNQWLAEQQNSIGTDIQIKLRTVINQALGVH